MKTLAIIHGWAEGPWQSKKFVKSLKHKGLQITNDKTAADVIFAHSLGCHLIPKEATAQLIVLVSPKYWPGKTVIRGLSEKLKNELKYHRRNEGLGWWFNKIIHNIWYILSKPQMTYYGITKLADENLPDGDESKVILVRPSDDTLLHPKVVEMLPAAKKYIFIEISGAHDDCWFKPEPYIGLIKKHL